MIGKVVVTSRYPFELNGTRPKCLRVICTSPPDHATPTYSIVADHGWAEKILCSGCYRHDANDIAEAIGDGLMIPVERAEDGPADRSRGPRTDV
jgi:hypothetical protein